MMTFQREQRKQQRRATKHAKFSRQISAAGECLIAVDGEAAAKRGEKGIELKSSLPILPMNFKTTTKTVLPSHPAVIGNTVSDFFAPKPTLEQLKVKVKRFAH